MGTNDRGLRLSARARAAGALTATALLLIATTAPAFADKPEERSAGRSSDARAGTIKIAEVGDDTHPNNDPKPGCDFRLDFYGFRAGTLDISIDAIPPTGRATVATDVLVIDETEHGNTWQASLDFDILDELRALTDDTRYHVKVSAKRRGSPGQGAKHKVFWLECPPEATGGSPGTFGGPVLTPPLARPVPPPPVRTAGGNGGPTGSVDAPNTRVLGGPPLVPASGPVRPTVLASTGTTIGGLLQAGLLLVLCGMLAIGTSKRLQRR